MTGVQTCALPIWLLARDLGSRVVGALPAAALAGGTEATAGGPPEGTRGLTPFGTFSDGRGESSGEIPHRYSSQGSKKPHTLAPR